ncbi:MAG: thioredoxin domain-containing protein, partial [Methanopyri archaeon]|nr:thioredoxin domain-containing protein [Methanopyri archaeon]
SCEVVVAGDRDGDDTHALLRTIRERYFPSTVVLLREPDDDAVVDLAPFTKDMRPVDGKATAYVCQGTACERPVSDVSSLQELLDAQSRRRPR